MSNNDEYIRAMTTMQDIFRTIKITKNNYVLAVRVTNAPKTQDNIIAISTTSSMHAPPTLSTLSLLTHEKNKSQLPRLAMTCCNMKDECFACDLSMEDLNNHRREISMSSISWAQYLQLLHHALQQNALEEMSFAFTDQDRDIVKIVSYAPLDSIKLKYTFELAAIRDAQEYMEKTCNLVFDLAAYTSQLYAKHQQEKQHVEQLQKEVIEVKSKLSIAEERLVLLEHPASTTAHLIDGGMNDDDAHANKNASNKRGMKRKAGALIHPAEKRQKRTKGAQIK